MPGPLTNSSPTLMHVAPVDAEIEPTVPPVVLAAPNASNGVTWLANQMLFFLDFFPGLNMGSMAPATIGPPGAGVGSGTCMGPARYLMGCPIWTCGPFPVTTQLNPTLQNLTNAPGLPASPGQVLVISGS